MSNERADSVSYELQPGYDIKAEKTIRQPWPNDCWCVGCDPDCCEGCPPPLSV